MNEKVFYNIAITIATKVNEETAQHVAKIVIDKNVDELVSMAKDINMPISLNDYLQLLGTDYLTDRAAQNKFIAQYLNIKGITCTPIEIDRYNENIRVALMREASSVCDEL